MDLEDLIRLNDARNARQRVISVTDLATGETLTYGEKEPYPALGQEAIAETLKTGRPSLTLIEGREYFINLYLPQPRLLVIGAVHISQALVKLARVLNFATTIIDPRTAFASQERFSGVDLMAVWPEEAFQSQPPDRNTALVALTHDPKIDDFALQTALSAGCFYIGALGSRKTHAARVQRFADLGVNGIERIRAPIGLDIGATGPEEVAVAILAEIIAAYRWRLVLPTSRHERRTNTI